MINATQTTRHLYGEKPDKAGNLNLSLFVSPFVLMYAIFENGQLTEISHTGLEQLPGTSLAEKARMVINNHQLHRKNYTNVNIAILNQVFTLIPEAYYSQEHARKLLLFASGKNDIKNVLQHQVRNTRFCYTPDSDLYAYLGSTFSNASIRHAGAVSLALFFSHHALARQDVFLNIGEGLIELAVKAKDELVFYNVFNAVSDEDILYYLLFTMEQVGLDPATTRLAVASDRETGDTLTTVIKKYVQQVTYCVPDPSLKMTGDMAGMPHHHYFTLIHQHLCEL